MRQVLKQAVRRTRTGGCHPSWGAAFGEMFKRFLRAGTACLFNPSKPLKRAAKSDLRNGASSKLSSARIFAQQMMDKAVYLGLPRRQPAPPTPVGVLRGCKTHGGATRNRGPRAGLCEQRKNVGFDIQSANTSIAVCVLVVRIRIPRGNVVVRAHSKCCLRFEKPWIDAR